MELVVSPNKNCYKVKLKPVGSEWVPGGDSVMTGPPPPPPGHPPRDGAEVAGPLGLVLPGEPHLQELLRPLEEVCTVLLHRETTDVDNRK